MKTFLQTLFSGEVPATLSAPLAGVSDEAFQRILRDCNAPVISTEMIPTASLAKHPKGLPKILRWYPGIHPINAQLFGYSAEHMVQTIDLIRYLQPDIIDINMGCPAKKIFRNAAGLALMNDLPRATRIVRAVRSSFSGPLSIKIRLGVQPGDFRAPDFARMAESEGVDFITVHGRYRTTYSQPADWDSIAAVRDCVSFPVIGNGDIFTLEDARNLIKRTGCNGVMIARGLLGNPWLPGRIDRFFRTGVIPPEPTLQERLRVFAQHLDYLIQQYGERKGILIFRKHAAWYLKGFRHVSQFRRQIFTLTRPEEFYKLVIQIVLNDALNPRTD
ncbi:tRNA-dihydrouridine synthase [bacterium]|nr:tRNA-dihydrouridine synthase [candidate division CSSED10-310 bacterium]